jgi:hypothetical protein
MSATLLGVLLLLGNAGPLPAHAVADHTATRDQNGLVLQLIARFEQAGMIGVSASYDRRVGDKPLWMRPHLGYASRFAARYHGEQHSDNTLLVGCGVAYGVRFRATADGYLATGPRDHLSIDGVEVASHWGTDVTAAVGGEFMARTGFMVRLSFGVSYFANLPPLARDHQTWNPITLLHLGTKF